MLKKLKRLKVEEKLKSMGLYVFTPREFIDIFKVKRDAALFFIWKNLQSGLFVKIRNGFYMLKDSYPPLYSIANKLYRPSYISLFTALSYYGIIPEVVYSVTSISTKPTREFETPLGVFSYRSIKKNVFTGYRPLEMEGTTVLFAEPEKALADYLYFVSLKKYSLNDRLRLKKIKKTKLLAYAKLYERPGLISLIQQVYANQRIPPRIV